MGDILHGKAPENRCFLLEGEWVEGDSMAPPNENAQKMHIAI
jgi:hypothetical protein